MSQESSEASKSGEWVVLDSWMKTDDENSDDFGDTSRESALEERSMTDNSSHFVDLLPEGLSKRTTSICDEADSSLLSIIDDSLEEVKSDSVNQESSNAVIVDNDCTKEIKSPSVIHDRSAAGVEDVKDPCKYLPTSNVKTGHSSVTDKSQCPKDNAKLTQSDTAETCSAALDSRIKINSLEQEGVSAIKTDLYLTSKMSANCDFNKNEDLISDKVHCTNDGGELAQLDSTAVANPSPGSECPNKNIVVSSSINTKVISNPSSCAIAESNVPELPVITLENETVSRKTAHTEQPELGQAIGLKTGSGDITVCQKDNDDDGNRQCYTSSTSEPVLSVPRVGNHSGHEAKSSCGRSKSDTEDQTRSDVRSSNKELTSSSDLDIDLIGVSVTKETSSEPTEIEGLTEPDAAESVASKTTSAISSEIADTSSQSPVGDSGGLNTDPNHALAAYDTNIARDIAMESNLGSSTGINAVVEPSVCDNNLPISFCPDTTSQSVHTVDRISCTEEYIESTGKNSLSSDTTADVIIPLSESVQTKKSTESTSLADTTITMDTDLLVDTIHETTTSSEIETKSGDEEVSSETTAPETVPSKDSDSVITLISQNIEPAESIPLAQRTTIMIRDKDESSNPNDIVHHTDDKIELIESLPSREHIPVLTSDQTDFTKIVQSNEDIPSLAGHTTKLTSTISTNEIESSENEANGEGSACSASYDIECSLSGDPCSKETVESNIDRNDTPQPVSASGHVLALMSDKIDFPNSNTPFDRESSTVTCDNSGQTESVSSGELTVSAEKSTSSEHTLTLNSNTVETCISSQSGIVTSDKVDSSDSGPPIEQPGNFHKESTELYGSVPSAEQDAAFRSSESIEQTVTLTGTESSENVSSIDQTPTVMSDITESSANARSFKQTTSSSGETDPSPVNAISIKHTALLSNESYESVSSIKQTTNLPSDKKETAEETATLAPATIETSDSVPSVKETSTLAPHTTETSESVPYVEETATLASDIKETSESVPCVEETATLSPDTIETTASVPSVEDTATLASDTIETSESVPSVEETATLASDIKETSERVPCVEETAATLAPATTETSASVPSVEETATLAHDTIQTSESVPSVEETATVAPATTETYESVPSVEDTATLAPATIETSESAPSVEQTTILAPHTIETSESVPSVEETATVAPATIETSESAPSAEQTTTLAPDTIESSESVPCVAETATLAPVTTETSESAPSVEQNATLAPDTIETCESVPSVEETALLGPATIEASESAPSVEETATLAPDTIETSESVPFVKETATLAPATTETSKRVPCVEETATFSPYTIETSESVPCVEKTATLAPDTTETSGSVPCVEETPTLAPDTINTSESVPSVEDTATLVPDTIETCESVPCVEATATLARDTTETSEIVPSVEETATVAPATTETSESAPSVEQTATLAPDTTETSEIVPCVEETATLAPDTIQTSERVPSVENTATLAPDTIETSESVPCIEETATLAPDTKETSGSVPCVEETATLAPDTKETSGSVPCVEETATLTPDTINTSESVPSVEDTATLVPDTTETSDSVHCVEETAKLAPATLILTHDTTESSKSVVFIEETGTLITDEIQGSDSVLSVKLTASSTSAKTESFPESPDSVLSVEQTGTLHSGTIESSSGEHTGTTNESSGSVPSVDQTGTLPTHAIESSNRDSSITQTGKLLTSTIELSGSIPSVEANSTLASDDTRASSVSVTSVEQTGTLASDTIESHESVTAIKQTGSLAAETIKSTETSVTSGATTSTSDLLKPDNLANATESNKIASSVTPDMVAFEDLAAEMKQLSRQLSSETSSCSRNNKTSAPVENVMENTESSANEEQCVGVEKDLSTANSEISQFCDKITKEIGKIAELTKRGIENEPIQSEITDSRVSKAAKTISIENSTVENIEGTTPPFTIQEISSIKDISDVRGSAENQRGDRSFAALVDKNNTANSEAGTSDIASRNQARNIAGKITSMEDKLTKHGTVIQVTVRETDMVEEDLEIVPVSIQNDDSSPDRLVIDTSPIRLLGSGNTTTAVPTKQSETSNTNRGTPSQVVNQDSVTHESMRRITPASTSITSTAGKSLLQGLQEAKAAAPLAKGIKITPSLFPFGSAPSRMPLVSLQKEPLRANAPTAVVKTVSPSASSSLKQHTEKTPTSMSATVSVPTSNVQGRPIAVLQGRPIVLSAEQKKIISQAFHSGRHKDLEKIRSAASKLMVNIRSTEDGVAKPSVASPKINTWKTVATAAPTSTASPVATDANTQRMVSLVEGLQGRQPLAVTCSTSPLIPRSQISPAVTHRAADYASHLPYILSHERAKTAQSVVRGSSRTSSILSSTNIADLPYIDGRTQPTASQSEQQRDCGPTERYTIIPRTDTGNMPYIIARKEPAANTSAQLPVPDGSPVRTVQVSGPGTPLLDVEEQGANISPKTKNKPKLFRCPICQKYTQYLSLYLYDLNHHLDISVRTTNPFQKATFLYNNGEYKCESCQFKSSYRGVFLEHVRMHTVLTPYRCGLCNESCKDIKDLKNHNWLLHKWAKIMPVAVITSATMLDVMRRLGPAAPPTVGEMVRNVVRREKDQLVEETIMETAAGKTSTEPIIIEEDEALSSVTSDAATSEDCHLKIVSITSLRDQPPSTNQTEKDTTQTSKRTPSTVLACFYREGYYICQSCDIHMEDPTPFRYHVWYDLHIRKKGHCLTCGQGGISSGQSFENCPIVTNLMSLMEKQKRTEEMNIISKPIDAIGISAPSHKSPVRPDASSQPSINLDADVQLSSNERILSLSSNLHNTEQPSNVHSNEQLPSAPLMQNTELSVDQTWQEMNPPMEIRPIVIQPDYCDEEPVSRENEMATNLFTAAPSSGQLQPQDSQSSIMIQAPLSLTSENLTETNSSVLLPEQVLPDHNVMQSLVTHPNTAATTLPTSTSSPISITQVSSVVINRTSFPTQTESPQRPQVDVSPLNVNPSAMPLCLVPVSESSNTLNSQSVASVSPILRSSLSSPVIIPHQTILTTNLISGRPGSQQNSSPQQKTASITPPRHSPRSTPSDSPSRAVISILKTSPATTLSRTVSPVRTIVRDNVPDKGSIPQNTTHPAQDKDPATTERQGYDLGTEHGQSNVEATTENDVRATPAKPTIKDEPEETDRNSSQTSMTVSGSSISILSSHPSPDNNDMASDNDAEQTSEATDPGVTTPQVQQEPTGRKKTAPDERSKSKMFNKAKKKGNKTKKKSQLSRKKKAKQTSQLQQKFNERRHMIKELLAYGHVRKGSDGGQNQNAVTDKTKGTATSTPRGENLPSKDIQVQSEKNSLSPSNRSNETSSHEEVTVPGLGETQVEPLVKSSFGKKWKSNSRRNYDVIEGVFFCYTCNFSSRKDLPFKRHLWHDFHKNSKKCGHCMSKSLHSRIGECLIIKGLMELLVQKKTLHDLKFTKMSTFMKAMKAAVNNANVATNADTNVDFLNFERDSTTVIEDYVHDGDDDNDSGEQPGDSQDDDFPPLKPPTPRRHQLPLDAGEQSGISMKFLKNIDGLDPTLYKRTTAHSQRRLFSDEDEASNETGTSATAPSGVSESKDGHPATAPSGVSERKDGGSKMTDEASIRGTGAKSISPIEKKTRVKKSPKKEAKSKVAEMERKLFRCDFCETACAQKSEMRRHMMEMHSDRLLGKTCDNDVTEGSDKPDQAPTTNGVAGGNDVHTNDVEQGEPKASLLHCPECTYTCAMISRFKGHIHTHGKKQVIRLYNCGHCDAVSNKMDQIEDHLLSQHPGAAFKFEVTQDKVDPGQYPHVCTVCYEPYDNQEALQQHTSVAHAKRNSTGNSVSTLKPSTLKLDTSNKTAPPRITSPKPRPKVAVYRFHCDLCEFSTNDLQSLQSHTTNHPEPVDDEVDSCDAVDEEDGFSTDEWSEAEDVSNEISELQSSPSEWYTCDMCPYKSTNKSLFRRHKNRHKAQAEIHQGLQCAYCSFRNLYNHIVVSHQRRYHPDLPKNIVEINPAQADSRSKKSSPSPAIDSTKAGVPDASTYRKFNKLLRPRAGSADSGSTTSRASSKSSVPPSMSDDLVNDIISQLPNTMLYREPVQCPMCGYSNRIRSNLVRHLSTHRGQMLSPMKNRSPQPQDANSSTIKPDEPAQGAPHPFDPKDAQSQELENGLEVDEDNEDYSGSESCDSDIYSSNDGDDEAPLNPRSRVPSDHTEYCYKVPNMELFNCNECVFMNRYPSKVRRHFYYKHAKYCPYRCGYCDFEAVESVKIKRHCRLLHTGQRVKVIKRSMKPATEKVKDEQSDDDADGGSQKEVEIEIDQKQSNAEMEKLVLSYIDKATGNIQTCRLCGYKQEGVSSLKRHVMAKHLKFYPILCTYCDSSFIEMNKAKKHISQAHPGMPFRIAKRNYENQELKRKVDIEIQESNSLEWDMDLSRDHVKELQTKLSSKSITDTAASPVEERNRTELSEWNMTPVDVASDNDDDEGDVSDLSESTKETDASYPNDNVAAAFYNKSPGKISKCKYCGYSSTNQSDVRRHVGRVHLKIKRFMCAYCYYGHMDKQRVNHHYKKCHKGKTKHIIQEDFSQIIVFITTDGAKEVAVVDRNRRAVELKDLHLYLRQPFTSEISTIPADEQGEKEVAFDNGIEQQKEVSTTEKPEMATQIIRSPISKDRTPKIEQSSKNDHFASPLPIPKSPSPAKTYPVQAASPGQQKLRKTYLCKLCSYYTPKRVLISSHVLSIHMKGKPHRCGYCDFNRWDRGLMMKHQEEQHPDLPVNIISVLHEQEAEIWRNVQEKELPVHMMDQSEIKTSPEKLGYEIAEPVTDVSVSHSTKSNLYVNSDQAGITDDNRDVSEKSGTGEYVCKECLFSATRKVPFCAHVFAKHLKMKRYKCCYCEFYRYQKFLLIEHFKYTHPGEPVNIIDLQHEKEAELLAYALDRTQWSSDADKTSDTDDVDMPTEASSDNQQDVSVSSETLGSPTSVVSVCKKCSYYSFKKTLVSRHILGVHFRMKRYRCFYCTQQSWLRPVIVQHIEANHPGQDPDVVDVYLEQERNIAKYLGKQKKSDLPQKLIPNKHSRKHLEHVSPRKASSPRIRDNSLREVSVDNMPERTTGTSASPGSSPSKGSSVYTCNLCSFSSIKNTSISLHVLGKHLNHRRYRCRYCHYDSWDRNFVTGHLKISHPNQPLEVVDVRIEKEPQILSLFKKGKKIVNRALSSPGESLTCNICPHTAPTKQALHQHKRRHLKYRPFGCIYCDYKSFKRRIIEEHCVRMHDGPVKVKLFEKQPDVKDDSEMQEASAERTYEEDQSLVTAAQPSRHITTARKRKPFSRNFRAKKKLDAPYVCSYCGVLIKNHKYNMKRHINNRHPGMPVKYVKAKTAPSAPSDEDGDTEPPRKKTKVSKPSSTLSSLKIKFKSQPTFRKAKLTQTKRKAVGKDTQINYRCKHCQYLSDSKAIMKDHVMAAHMNYRPYKCPYCTITSVRGYPVKKHIQRSHLEVEEPHFELHKVEEQEKLIHHQYIVQEISSSSDYTPKVVEQVENTSVEQTTDVLIIESNGSATGNVDVVQIVDVSNTDSQESTTRGSTTVVQENLDGAATPSRDDFSPTSKRLNVRRGHLYRCKFCKHETNERESFKRHTMVEINYRPVCCPYCDQSYVIRQTCKRHILSRHKGKPFFCDVVKSNKMIAKLNQILIESVVKDNQPSSGRSDSKKPVTKTSSLPVRKISSPRTPASDGSQTDQHASQEMGSSPSSPVVDVTSGDHSEVVITSKKTGAKSGQLNKRRYQCGYCNSLFHLVYTLKKHSAEKHPFQALHWIRKSFSKESSAPPTFPATADSPFRFNCPIQSCPFVGHTGAALRTHINKCHVSSLPPVAGAQSIFLRCGYCSFGTYINDDFEEHAKTHTPEKRYLCGRCDYKSYRRYTVKDHSLRQHPDEEVKILEKENFGQNLPPRQVQPMFEIWSKPLFHFQPETRASDILALSGIELQKILAANNIKVCHLE